MNNKKVTYILIIVVACIWGAILLRVFGFIKSEKKSAPLIDFGQKAVQKLSDNDSVILIADYPDPFLGGRHESRREVSNNFSSNNYQIVPNISKIQPDKIMAPTPPGKQSALWPNIIYNGIVAHKASGKVIGLIIMENKEYIILPDSMYSGIYVHKIFSDSILVSYQREKRIIKKTIN